MRKLRFTMSRERALELGLLHCEHCGWPPNNHFDFGNRPCAHDPDCPGYQEGTKRDVKLETVEVQ